MQEIEKSKILTKLEELNLQIKENTISHIGIHISKYNELLAESTLLKDFYFNRIAKYNTLVQKEEVKTLLINLFCYIKTFSGMKICKNFIPEVNKIAVDGSLSSLFYSNKISIILTCIINNEINVSARNFNGIITFYCQILSYACGSLINQNIDTSKMLEIQNDLLNLEKNLKFYLIDCADFKILNFAKNNIDFSKNTKITNEIYQTSLFKVIEETKKYVKLLSVSAKPINNVQLLNNLSKAEKELFNYLVKGYTIPKIASILNKSSNTLKTQQQSLFNKLNVNNKNELIENFTRNG